MKYGDKVAFVDGARQLTFREFDEESSRLAHGLARLGIRKGDRVAIVLNSILTPELLAGADTSSLRCIIYGGAPIAPERLRQELAAFENVFVQIYGSSEAAQVGTTLTLADHAYEGDTPPPRLRSVGRAGLNIELRVVNEDGEIMPTGEIGEIAIRGDHTMVGYWKNPALTASRVRDGWVFTGDMGYLDSAGYLYLVDRKDDMIITGGFNVWPTEIEAILYEHPDVKEVAVFGVQSMQWGEQVTAVVVPRDVLREGGIAGYTAPTIQLAALCKGRF